MKYIFSALALFLLVSCGIVEKKITPLKEVKNKEETTSNIVIEDLRDIPQDVNYYSSYIQNTNYMIDKEFEKSYFSTWNMKKPKEILVDITWPFRYFNTTKSYGENLLPIKQSFFDSMYEMSNYKNYLTLNKKALTLNYTNIRALPTNKPLLRDPSLAGEGFPFDYLQNSAINPNVPLFVSHYSKDKQWVFVFSSYTYGWIESKDVVFINDINTQKWQNAKQVYITKEGIPLYTQANKALFNTRIGMIFALIDEDENNYTLLTVSTFKNNEAMFHKSKISKKFASLTPLSLSRKNINTIIREVSKTNYGWGGVYEQRDCSSTLMDLYAAFGIALPRNSSKQAKVGKIIDLSNLNNSDKEKMIKEKGVPFETLLYKKGHIVLYAGVYNDEIIIFHNTWGIKTKINAKEGRFLIGKTIFSTLKIGKELKGYDKSAELLRNIKSMNIITR